MARFKGFSTINRYKKFTLTDNELIKRDLLNALSIREGELPGRPSFGTRLWNFIFEPNTPDIVRQITAELERTVTYDPRIRIEDVVVTTDPEGVILELVVAFVPDLNPQVLQIKFDEESQTAQYL
jgi:phage baseplate assembly protein W